MYFLALAADFDGTLAKSGSVEVDTIQAIREFRKTGRRLLLVTGRELVDLKHAFPELDLFDRVVAENGAVIYDPATSAVRVIAPAPPSTFIRRLIEQNVHPISIGHSVLATWHPHETTVLQIIQELGLELHIVFNKGAVMVLPTNVSKASGVQAALKELDISPLNVVAVGDAENDQSFLHLCGCAAAVGNALPVVSQSADIKLQADHGAGVRELMQRIAHEDSRVLPPSQRGILAGVDWDGEPVYLTVEEYCADCRKFGRRQVQPSYPAHRANGPGWLPVLRD
jgi:HAD superfamily hydrolase (TIGR01484 family)